MPDQNIKIGLDSSQVETGAAKFRAILERNGVSIDNLVAKIAEFNKLGQLSKAVFEGFTESGEKIEGTLKKITNGYQVSKIAIQENSAELQKFRSANDQTTKSIQDQQTASTPVAARMDSNLDCKSESVLFKAV